MRNGGGALFNKIFNDMTIPGGYNAAYRFEYMFKTGRYSHGAKYEFGPEYFKGEVSWIDALSDGEEFCVGNAYMGELTFSLNEDGDYSMIKPSDEIELYIRLITDTEQSSWVFIGLYMPIEILHDRKTKKWNFKCFDLMYRYDREPFLDGYTDPTFPITYHEAVLRMANLCGIGVDWPDEADNLSIAEGTIQSSDTCRQVLAYMLLTIGANVRMRFEGAFGIYYVENLPPAPSNDAIITTGSQHISRLFPETGLFEEVYEYPVRWGLCDGVKLDDGRIFFAPQEDYGKMTIYDPQSGDITISEATVDYDYNIQWANYWCSVVIPGNKVVMIPYGRVTIGLYDVTNDIWTDGPSVEYGYGDRVWGRSCLLPDGRIIVAPYNAPKIGIYDTNTGMFSVGPAHGLGPGAFSDAVLASNGKVILIPAQQRKIGIYDPESNTFVTGPDAGTKYGTGYEDLYFRGFSASNGNIILMPGTTNTLGIYDPVLNIYSDGVVFSGSTTSGSSVYYIDGLIMPDGKMFFVPGTNRNSYAAIYNPEDDTYVQSVYGITSNYRTCVLSSDKTKIIICPNFSNRFLIYDIASDTIAQSSQSYNGNLCQSAAISSDGDALFFPGGNGTNTQNIIKYNYTTDTISYIATGYTRGNKMFSGATAMPDGNIFLSAYNAMNFGIFNIVNNSYSDGPSHPFLTGNSPYSCAFLTPDKTKVIMVPWYDEVPFGIYDIASNAFSKGVVPGSQWNSGAMLDNGTIILEPHLNKISSYDYITDTYTVLLSDASIGSKNTTFKASNGNIIFPSRTITEPFIIYDPQTNTYTTVGNPGTYIHLNYKDDQIVCAANGGMAYKYNMSDGTFSDIAELEIDVISGGVYVRLSDVSPDYDAVISEYEYNTITDENLPVTGITMEGIDGRKITRGNSTGLMLNVHCPWGDDQHADFLYTKLRGYIHVPVNLDNGIVNPLLEPNDIVLGNDSGQLYRITYTAPRGAAMLRVDCENGKWLQYEFSGTGSRQVNENKKEIKKTEKEIKAVEDEVKVIEEQMSMMRQIIIVPGVQLSNWAATTEGGATWMTTYANETITADSVVIVSADINTQNALGQVYTKTALGSVNIYITLEQISGVYVDLMIIV